MFLPIKFAYYPSETTFLLLFNTEAAISTFRASYILRFVLSLFPAGGNFSKNLMET